MNEALTEAERMLLDLLGYRPAGSQMIDGEPCPVFRLEGARKVRTCRDWRKILAQAVEIDPFMALAADIVFGRLLAREKCAAALRDARRAERERCAQVAAEWRGAGGEIAAAIRALGDEPGA